MKKIKKCPICKTGNFKRYGNKKSGHIFCCDNCDYRRLDEDFNFSYLIDKPNPHFGKIGQKLPIKENKNIGLGPESGPAKEPACIPLDKIIKH